MTTTIVTNENVISSINASTEQSGGQPLKIIADKLAASISTAMLQALAVTTEKIAALAVTAAKLATDAVETAKIKNANVTNAKLASECVTADKISHDNTRVKIILNVVYDTATIGQFGKIGGIAFSATLGIPMTRAGSITMVVACAGGGFVSGHGDPQTYGVKTFAQGDRLAFKVGDDGYGVQVVEILKNGVSWWITQAYIEVTNSIVSIEIEYGNS